MKSDPPAVPAPCPSRYAHSSRSGITPPSEGPPLPGLELDYPVVLSLQTQGHEELAELHEVFQAVARNRILLNGQGVKPRLRRQWQRLRELANQCKWVDQIRLRYHQEPIGEPDEWIDQSHGGEGGSDLGDMELGTGVGIARLHGLSGVPNGRVDQLELTTSDGQRRGGGGTKGNKTLDWQTATNQVLLGFHGRSAAELDALTAVIATFGPLAWEPVLVEEDP